ncbi:hypothetical protein H1V43_30400 [Streptomyces sp. PSKA54]|uniref:Uncharacterized protein n=1 Tax=Streptomyces himalayensis subsp. aureolus TaxID=2758039 RepID=A0A7W2HIZ9_9ACTN|nr:hypothetical protein [Streptomyces himalayensis]MBA4865575.1 hypothetical protein [Streptomyces himalayensis subsp. aureolus]
MIKQAHETTVPAPGVPLALAVASEFDAPQTPAPAVAVPQPHLMGLRISSARPHRRKVPLKRLTAAMC